ncbi:MAG: hypothetical protein ABI596_16110 [Pyrinomonadaceae bacterium]
MNSRIAKTDPRSSKRSRERSLSDGAPPIIIYIGDRKAFKDPVWLIRTLTQPVRRRLSRLNQLVPAIDPAG